MKILYDNLNIEFTIDNVLFSTLNISQERFLTTVPKHSHGNNCYELHFVAQGYGIVKINNTAYEITPNTIYITGPHVEHEQIPFPSDPMTEYCIFFMIKKKSDRAFQTFVLPPSIPSPDSLFWMGTAAQQLHPLFQKIFDEFKIQNTGYLFQVSTLLQQCIIATIRHLQTASSIQNSGTSPAHLSDSRTFIIDKAFLYKYRTLTLMELASYLKLSPRQTERFLQKNYKKSFSEKLLDARMSAAAVLLNRPALSIVEIAEQLGYSSLEYFSAVFKKYYQISPRKYRQEMLR